jgi:hypothetical protein
MTQSKPQTSHLLGIIGIVLIATNAFFFLASNSYAQDHLLSNNHLMATRIAFAISSIVVGMSAFGATYEPRLVGHAFGFLLSVSMLVGGIAAFIGHLPPVLGFTMLMVAGITGVLAFHSMRGSRVAWSFLTSLMAVMGIVTLFGAPKVRNLLHIGLWYAIIIPGLLAVGVVALGLIRRDYSESVSQKSHSAAL